MLFRCHALSAIMTHIDKDEIQKGHKTAAKDLFKQHYHHRNKVITAPQLTKGLRHEEDALTLLARVLKTMVKKNEERLYNHFITGIPDTFIGETIRQAQKGYDTKVCADYWTFPDRDEELPSENEFQNHGYMYLTGATEWSTVHTLVNSDADEIIELKKKVWYGMGQPADTDEEYRQACINIEKNTIFNIEDFLRKNPYYDFTLPLKDWQFDLSLSERVLIRTVKRDEKVIAKIADRVHKLRNYITAYYAKYYATED